jgi:hypothetical protein
LIPTPIWRAYFSPFVISVVLFTAALYSELTPNVRRQARLALWVCALAIVAINIRADMGRIGATFEPDRWMGEEIHRRGQLLRSAVPQDARGRPVATLSPVYALEAGLPIYPELATGQFAFRIGGLLSSEEIRLYRTASTATLESLLDREPPSAVFIGFADGQDSSLVEYARKRGFVKHTVVPRRADVWVSRSERNRLESRSEISE